MIDPIENDLDYRAYQRMLAAGQLKPYRGRWVAVGHESLLVVSDSLDSLLQAVSGIEEPLYVHRVLRDGETEPVVHLRSPLKTIKI